MSVEKQPVTHSADSSDESSPQCAVIVLTMGNRPAEVQRLATSLGSSDRFEGLLIANGAAVDDVPGWQSIRTEENLGIAGGRHFGANQASADVLVFLDDDATVRTSNLLDELTAAFAEDPTLGAIGMRLVVTDTDESLREWQPRLFGRGDNVSGPVTSFLGGAHAIRRDAYRQVGGYAPDFWYAHEETDLAWRLLDKGWDIGYRADLFVEHPRTKPSRHADHLYYSARNRIWVARRNLPLAMASAYIMLWLAIQLVRSRSFAHVRGVLRGTRAGFRDDAGARSPMSWRTVLEMTRRGRPPLL